MTNAQRLARIRGIIEAVDNRCAAADGPVTPTLQEMEQKEISAIYALACGKPGRFVAPIRVGLGLPVLNHHYEIGGYLPGQPITPKRQTIRFEGRKRHARPGELVQLFHAQRSPKCFAIGEGRCVSIAEIRLFIHAGRIEIWRLDGTTTVILPGRRLEKFANDDGFANWSDMRAFWLSEHKGKQLGPFVGVLIKWEALK